MPISECTFTGIGVNNIRAYESAGEAEEFTGTILKAIEEFLYIELDEIEDNIEKLIYAFCGEDWVIFGYEENFEVKLASVDREVTEEEVRAYLQELQDND